MRKFTKRQYKNKRKPKSVKNYKRSGGTRFRGSMSPTRGQTPSRSEYDEARQYLDDIITSTNPQNFKGFMSFFSLKAWREWNRETILTDNDYARAIRVGTDRLKQFKEDMSNGMNPSMKQYKEDVHSYFIRTVHDAY
jgi:hypothetical protein